LETHAPINQVNSDCDAILQLERTTSRYFGIPLTHGVSYLESVSASARKDRNMAFGRSTLSLSAAVTAVLFVAALGGCASHPKPSPPAPPSAAAPQGPPGGEYAAPPRGAVTTTPLPGTTQDFVVNVGDRVYFDYDQSEIRPDARPILQAQADWLARYPQVFVRIEGNCDERGTREYNFALGARRADAVREFLIDRGVSAGRITTISYGKERPIDPGPDEAAWAKNRNAHTAIVEGARGP
jgi:peptidoglycan-associated lipoprotein